ncbi:MAG: type II secretion system GspH family protein [Gammaproteobacteria bacterium]|nr:type II secretion system GspH family protein [Gammaproteobacteria bacterium]MBU1980445.1 type II secretion system GspH family protein [Gammaproteobacteria bacterium]
MGSTRTTWGGAARYLKSYRPDRSCGGFTYIGVLLAVVFIGVALAATGTVWQQTRQREKERELLFVGNQFRQALEGYYEKPPPGKGKKFPQKIEDLLQDDRYPGVKRYLRVIYRDPMTGSAEWGLLKGADQGIVGLYSLSDGEPLKTANFDLDDAGLAGKLHYYEWRFIAKAGVIAEAGVAASNAMGTDVLVPPSGQPDAPQSLSAADSELPPQQELPPGAKNSAACTATFMNARAGCLSMSRKGGLSPTIDCLQKASAQYSQCLK